MVYLLQNMQDPKARAVLTNTLLLAPPPVVSTRATSATVSEKTKKALNAFVGFRCMSNSCHNMQTTNPLSRLLHLLPSIQGLANEEALTALEHTMGE